MLKWCLMAFCATALLANAPAQAQTTSYPTTQTVLPCGDTPLIIPQVLGNNVTCKILNRVNNGCNVFYYYYFNTRPSPDTVFINSTLHVIDPVSIKSGTCSGAVISYQDASLASMHNFNDLTKGGKNWGDAKQVGGNYVGQFETVYGNNCLAFVKVGPFALGASYKWDMRGVYCLELTKSAPDFKFSNKDIQRILELADAKPDQAKPIMTGASVVP